MHILLFLRVLHTQAHTFPTSPAGCLEGNQKKLAIKVGGRVGPHHSLNERVSITPIHAKKKPHCEGHSLGIGGFEERITEAFILALYLGEPIRQNNFLGANAKWSLCQVLKQA